MVDTPPRQFQPGWFEVALVAAAVVLVVLGAGAISGILPAPIREAILNGPVMIGVLIIGTAWLLWRISRGRPVDGER